MTESNGEIYEVTWQQVADSIKEINPELHEIIAELDPDPSYRLYVGEYPYGYEILDKGKFQVPTEHGKLPINDPRVPNRIKEDLSYNAETNPVCLVMENGFEVFISDPSVTMPLFIFIPRGGVFSVSRVVSDRPHHPAFLWTMTSGARSTFMLPKISQTRKIRRLGTALNIDIEVPRSNLEHWELFKNIACSEQAPVWNAKILYFSKQWFEHLDDPAWIKFKVFLLEKFQRSFDSLGNLFIWDMIFSMILRKNKIRPSLHVNNLARQIFNIGIGVVSGMAPTINEAFLPISYIQTVFSDIYQLDDYLPTIMAPAMFNPYDSCPPTYYSLQNSTMVDTPRKRDNTSLISELYDVQSLMSKYIKSLQSDYFNIEGTPLSEFANRCQVESFHPDSSRYSIINDSQLITAEDARFQQVLSNPGNKEVANYSSFFKGCLRIKHVEE